LREFCVRKDINYERDTSRSKAIPNGKCEMQKEEQRNGNYMSKSKIKLHV
jgi:hypothetical protein